MQGVLCPKDTISRRPLDLHGAEDNVISIFDDAAQQRRHSFVSHIVTRDHLTLTSS